MEKRIASEIVMPTRRRLKPRHRRPQVDNVTQGIAPHITERMRPINVYSTYILSAT